MSVLEGVLSELAALESAMDSRDIPDESKVIGAESGIFVGDGTAYIEQDEADDDFEPEAVREHTPAFSEALPSTEDAPEPAPPSEDGLELCQKQEDTEPSVRVPALPPALENTVKSVPVPDDVREAGDRFIFTDKLRSGLPAALILAGESLDYAAEAVRKARAAVDVLTRIFVAPVRRPRNEER